MQVIAKGDAVTCKGKLLLQTLALVLAMAHRDSESGEYSETYPLEEFVQAIDRLGGDVGTKDVEHAVGCQYRTAIAKLHELEDRSIVTSRRVGNAYLWSLADTPDRATHSVDQGSTSDDSTQDEQAASATFSEPYDPTDEWE